MPEAAWHEARLIPTSGINGAEEQERRATSALLAVMAAVKEFGRALTKPLGAPAGTVETFIEVPFELRDQRLYPDGLVRVSRGQRSWTALVEVKTGNNELQPEQLENYLDIARERGYDAVISISNEISPVAGQHPTKIDKRKLKKVPLHHLSWTRVLTEAVMQKEFRGIADPDQAWILGELIRYLEHPKSGAMEFEDMGASWVPVRDAVHSGMLRSGDKGLAEVTARFDALLRYISLRLGRQLGAEVTPVLSKKEMDDPALRQAGLGAALVDRGVLAGEIRIPDTVGRLVLTADLRARSVTVHVDIDAPGEGRPRTRVNWLLRQLKHAPDGLMIEAFVARSRSGSAGLHSAVREEPTLLLPDPAKPPRSFRLAMSAPMGSKRGRGRGAFIDSMIDLVDEFYAVVMQDLKSWSAAPPRLRQEQVQPDGNGQGNGSVASTALSSQDGTEVASSEVSEAPVR